MADLFIIGGGPAGYNAAKRAAALGMSVIIAEKSSMGGVCLNEGCIPSKTLLNSSKIYDYCKNAERFGVNVGNYTLSHEIVLNRKKQVVSSLVKGIEFQMKASKVEIIKETAKIKGINQKGVFTIVCNNKEYQSSKLLICTGSQVAIPPIPGIIQALKNGVVITSREILNLREVPAELAVIGGGVIGLEMASYFNSMGVKVTVIEMLDHIGGSIDCDIAAVLQKNYSKKGVSFLLNTKVDKIDYKKISLSCNGQKSEISSEKILLCTGRKPFIEDIGLDNIGVKCKNGHIEVNSCGETNVANVYAAGDVNGVFMLAHVAYREGEVCVNNMVGKDDIMSYKAIPSVIYTSPEVASTGLSEREASAQGISFDKFKLPLNYSGRYIAENGMGDGFCKILVDAQAQTIIGGHMIGSYASEIITVITTLIEEQVTVEDVKKMVFPHPTVCEIIRECLFE